MKEVHIARTALESGEKGLTVHISGMTLAMNARWKYKQKSWYKTLLEIHTYNVCTIVHVLWNHCFILVYLYTGLRSVMMGKWT